MPHKSFTTCLGISVNGKRICTAGLEDGIVTAEVNTTEAGAAPVSGVIAVLHVHGSSTETGLDELLSWGMHELTVGDSVEIKIISTDEFDEPTLREPRTGG